MMSKPLSAVDCIGPAFTQTKQQLFAPFRSSAGGAGPHLPDHRRIRRWWRGWRRASGKLQFTRKADKRWQTFARFTQYRLEQNSPLAALDSSRRGPGVPLDFPVGIYQLGVSLRAF